MRALVQNYIGNCTAGTYLLKTAGNIYIFGRAAGKYRLGTVFIKQGCNSQTAGTYYLRSVFVYYAAFRNAAVVNMLRSAAVCSSVYSAAVNINITVLRDQPCRSFPGTYRNIGVSGQGHIIGKHRPDSCRIYHPFAAVINAGYYACAETLA